MKVFIPEQAIINPRALEYETGQQAKAYLENLGVPILVSNRVKIEGDTPAKLYQRSKNTVYITLNKEKKLRPCSPSADYQFALSSSCPGHCEYCYLQTTQGEKPYIKVFVNIEEIFQVLQQHMDDNDSDITTFECSSITDPIPFEPMTGSLRKCIEYFGESEKGRLRFVTKYHMVDNLLDAKHNGHTTFRFSVNTDYIIQKFEHVTSKLNQRLSAAKKVVEAGYSVGFIFAPIMRYDGWKGDYKKLIINIKEQLPDDALKISFELIQHRYTETAKKLIQSRFPNTQLDMKDENRQLKWGPYGKFKYVYKKEDSQEIKDYISDLIYKYFKNGSIDYFT